MVPMMMMTVTMVVQTRRDTDLPGLDGIPLEGIAGHGQVEVLMDEVLILATRHVVIILLTVYGCAKGKRLGLLQNLLVNPSHRRESFSRRRS